MCAKHVFRSTPKGELWKYSSMTLMYDYDDVTLESTRSRNRGHWQFRCQDHLVLRVVGRNEDGGGITNTRCVNGSDTARYRVYADSTETLDRLRKLRLDSGRVPVRHIWCRRDRRSLRSQLDSGFISWVIVFDEPVGELLAFGQKDFRNRS